MKKYDVIFVNMKL